MTQWVRGRGRRGERGVVAVWTAILAIVIFGVGAFAVDVSRWYVEGARLQKTVDNAALSGVVYLPGDVGQAQAIAQDIATENGWTIPATEVGFDGQPEVTFDAQPEPDRPTRLRVTMSSDVEGGLGGVLGLTNNRITRTAVADYAGPLPLGSPCNIFGRQDMENAAWGGLAAETNCLGNSLYWVNTAGENTNKARGDGFASGYCTDADASDRRMDRCAENGAPPYNQSSWTTVNPNLDYDPNGYIFIIKPFIDGDIRLQVFDMGWVAVGDNCTDGVMRNNNARAFRNPFVSPAPQSLDEAAARYERGNTAFCTGDTEMTGPEGDAGVSGPVVTTVTVRNPSPNVWQPLDGTEICSHEYPGWRDDTTFPRFLNSSDDEYDAALARTFHRWMDPCAQATTSSGIEDINTAGGDYLTIPNAIAGEEYSIQIQTRNGGGQNRYALRARMAGAGDSSPGALRISAAGKVSLFNNVPAGTSIFNVVRLDSSAAGKVLNVEFFDLGDASDPVTSQVLQPDLDVPFPTCTGIGPTAGPLANCAVTTTLLTNGGKWQTIRIPIDQDYRCSDDENPAECWVRIRLNTTAPQSDTTTWRASLDGDPVRLVE